VSGQLLPIHPLAELFPALEGEAFDALVTDIGQHGVREEIVLFDSAILDGRNRYRAGLLADAIPALPWRDDGALAWPFRRFGDRPGETDPLAWVLSKNLHRRHLTESQRAMVAAKLATMGRGRPGDNGPIGPITAARAGELLNVGEMSIKRARAVQRDGVTELIAAVESGEVAVSPAMAVAALPKAEQAEIVARGKTEILAYAKRFRDEKTAEKKAKRAEVERRLGARQRAMPDQRYGVIYADPEWRFENWSDETGMDRAPENHYPTSDLETICRRDVASIAADDSVLLLWVPMSMLPDGLTVMARWGFTFATGNVWVKDRIGLGRWFRTRHELLLLGTRGNPPCPAPGTQWESVITAPLGRHSEKPANYYALIEAYFPSLPKIELNARTAREGWDAWGNEAP
jgi:N6-adenosine-specific RNA methylase IME4